MSKETNKTFHFRNTSKMDEKFNSERFIKYGDSKKMAELRREVRHERFKEHKKALIDNGTVEQVQKELRDSGIKRS